MNRTTPRSRRQLVALAVALLVSGAAIAGCSSDDKGSDGGSSGGSGGSAKTELAGKANAVCKDGKARTAKIVPGTLVVPDPSTAAEKAATKKWADATAAELDKTADALEALSASGDGADQLAALVKVYRTAADTLRTKGGAVLGQKNFLSDEALFAYGFTVCVAPVKADTPSTTEAP